MSPPPLECSLRRSTASSSEGQSPGGGVAWSKATRQSSHQAAAYLGAFLAGGGVAR